MNINYTINRNEQFNSLEITFEGKPSEAVRDILKSFRFRWHGVKKVWYGYADEKALRAALEGQEDKPQPSARKRSGTPQNRVRILYNGMKVDGTLYRCHYSINGDSVTVYGRDYNHLPRDFFPVHNDSDCMTDYFENDSAYITASHPFYPYFVYAAHKANAISDKNYIRTMEKRMEKPGDYYARHQEETLRDIERHRVRLAAFESMEDPGQPSQEDLDRIEQQKQEEETAKIAAKEEEERRLREKYDSKRFYGKSLIDEQMKLYPLKDGEPIVTINWSEHCAFYAWPDNTLKMSVAAAEIILRTFDAENHNDPDFAGYDKTSFTITGHYDDGKEFTYEGRYDLGDGERGMIDHIRSLGEWERTHEQFGKVKEQPDETNDRIQFADYLSRFTA